MWYFVPSLKSYYVNPIWATTFILCKKFFYEVKFLILLVIFLNLRRENGNVKTLREMKKLIADSFAESQTFCMYDIQIAIQHHFHGIVIQVSPFLSMDLLESCFPYSLLRNSYHSVHKGVQPPTLAA